MSLEMNTNQIVEEKVMKTLPAKYNKFAGFAYWLLGQMKDIQVLSANGYDETCEMMNLLSNDIPKQVEFYERFLTEERLSNRLMKVEMRTYKSKSDKNKKIMKKVLKMKKDKDKK